MLVVYPAIFHKDDGSIWVEFPDLEGCFTDGETIEEAIENASDALGLYIYTRFEKGWKTPKPSDIDTIEKPDDGFVSLVSSNPMQYERRTKAIKKTLTIPEWLNEEAEKRHINFSSVLREALIERIETN